MSVQLSPEIASLIKDRELLIPAIT
ncbi:MAG: hypothetical protein RL313_282, partial [Actinomycetota bacterium]